MELQWDLDALEKIEQQLRVFLYINYQMSVRSIGKGACIAACPHRYTLLGCLMLVYMDITLGERNTYSLGIERFLDSLMGVHVDPPVVR